MRADQRVVVGMIALCLATSGCGFGTVGIVASSSGGGDGNANAVTGDFSVFGGNLPETAAIAITLIDAESDTVAVEFLLKDSNDVLTRLTQIESNPVVLKTSPTGELNLVPWNFAAEPGIETTARTAFRLVARGSAGGEKLAVGFVGNDAPELLFDPPVGEQSGDVELTFGLRDSAGDAVSVMVDYLEVDGTPMPARAANLLGGQPASGLAVVNRPTDGGIETETFVWDTGSLPVAGGFPGDLIGVDRTVTVRVTVVDAGGATVSMFGDVHVDNNLPPTVELDDAFLVGDDDRRGVSVPFRVTDPEHDRVRVLFQWRGEGQTSFLPLGVTDPAELQIRLQDPAFLESRQICQPFPAWVECRIEQLQPTMVRIEALRDEQARLRANGLAGRSLQRLREEVPLVASLPIGTLLRPVAVASAGVGDRAWVLDSVNGNAALLEIELATGTVLRSIQSGLEGEPTALSLDEDGQRALVANRAGSGWTLNEVDLRTNVVTRLIASASTSGGMATLRGLQWMSATTAVAVSDTPLLGCDELLGLDWGGGERVSVLLDDLMDGRDVIRDPRFDSRLLVAESGADRIRSFRTDTFEDSVFLDGAGASQVNMLVPTGLAVRTTGFGAQLLVVCNPAQSSVQICAVDLVPDQTPACRELFTVTGVEAAVAGGAQRQVLVVEPNESELTAYGGVAIERVITEYESNTGIAILDREVPPASASSGRWRIGLAATLFRDRDESIDGRSDNFIWDATRIGSEKVRLRAVAFDSESGAADSTSVGRSIQNYSAVSLAGEPAPVGIIVDDFDLDGVLDLATVGRFNQELLIHFGRGGRAFFSINESAGSGGGSSVTAGFVAGNFADAERVDFAFSRGSEVRFLKQSNNGSFSNSGSLGLPQGYQPLDLASVDLNQDGLVDLAILGEDDSQIPPDRVVFAALKNGTSSNNWEPLTSTPVQSDAGSLAAADVNGDGYPDLAVAYQGGVELLEQDLPVPPLPGEISQATFTTRQIAINGFSRIVALSDLDGDGRMDLVAGGPNQIVPLLQLGDGSFMAMTPIAAAPKQIVCGDVDGDGDIDIACTDTERVQVFAQSGDGMFVRRPPLLLQSARQLALGDLDGDGTQDLVVSSGNSAAGGVTAFFSRSVRDFVSTIPVVAGIGATYVTAGDVDGDGDQDLIVVDEEIQINLQGTARTFGPETSLTPSFDAPAHVELIDVDFDGVPELVSASRGDGVDGGGVDIFVRDASGFFQATAPLATGIVPTAIAHGDFDGDGTVDLIVAGAGLTPGSGVLQVLVQTTPMSFTLSDQLFPADGEKQLLVRDVDADGDLDLVCANLGVNSITVYRQNVGGQFQREDVMTAPGLRSVDVADLDDDGFMDVLAVSLPGTVIQLFEQILSSQSMLPALNPIPSTLPAMNPTCVRAADIDGDGDPDIIATNQDGSFSLFARDGSLKNTTLAAGFVALPTPVLVAGLEGLGISDLDGDGDVDIVTVNSTTGTVQTLFGRTR